MVASAQQVLRAQQELQVSPSNGEEPIKANKIVKKYKRIYIIQ